MVGRLSVYAKNRILNLRFQKNNKIKHIAQTLLQEDSIKVSRESISTFLKKYIDTKSIHDKPRSGRNKKLTKEEIELIGEVTRLNRDITAPKIKQYLNLNVSTHTILRASKLFEWNKTNPNSNQAKRAAAMERQINGEANGKKRRSNRNRRPKPKPDESIDSSTNGSFSLGDSCFKEESVDKAEKQEATDCDLKLIDDKEIMSIINLSSSPMVFATKILLRIFELSELYGHNVSGKTFSKNIRTKKPLDEKRIRYIRWLVEYYFKGSDLENQWKLCRTAINKTILINEKKYLKSKNSEERLDQSASDIKNGWNTNTEMKEHIISCINSDTSDSSMFTNSTSSQLISHTFQMNISDETNNQSFADTVSSTGESNVSESNSKPKSKAKKAAKKSSPKFRLLEQPNDDEMPPAKNLNEEMDLNLMSEKDILLIKNLYCSPMIFATKLLQKIFTHDELCGHNLSGKTYPQVNRNLQTKKPLDETRVLYIQYLVEKYFDSDDKELLWKSCRKAIGRVLRNLEKKSLQVTNHNAREARSTINEEFYSNKEPLNVNMQYEANVINLNQSCMGAPQSFNARNSDESTTMNQSSIYLNDSLYVKQQSNLIPPDAYSGVEMIQQHQQQTENKHTVVVLVDDPEQQRQMMLEQEMEDNQKLAILSEQQQQASVSNTYQNLTTVTVLNLEQCY